MNYSRKTKEVFVFGAGASSASGEAPLGKNLVWNYYEDCSTMYRMGNNNKPAEDDLEEKTIEFINYGKFLKLADKVFPELDTYNKWRKEMHEGEMLTFPSQLDKRYYVDEMTKILQVKGDLEGVELLKQLTLEHIGKAGIGSSNSLYEEFIKKLAGKSSENVSIISLNFDCLLHEDFINGVYFDYLIDFAMVDEHRESYNKQNGVPLIKLNGSLDWAICQKCGKIKLLFHFVGKSSYDNLYCKMSKNCGEKLRPFIFLPHEEKNSLIHSLWDKARQDLSQATKITIIGYSFPPYDQDVINLFKESLSPDVELVIVDYAKDDKEKRIAEANYKRIKQAFLRDNTKLLLNGFQGYVQ